MKVIQLITFFWPEGNQVCPVDTDDICSIEIMESGSKGRESNFEKFEGGLVQ
jgi:hypothetical protein